MRFGDVVLLDYPFTDITGSKKRPALVLLPEPDGDILFARVTSKDRDGTYDVALEDWKTVGLAFPSIVRLSKIATLHSNLVLRRIGTLSLRDMESVQNALHRLISGITR